MDSANGFHSAEESRPWIPPRFLLSPVAFAAAFQKNQPKSLKSNRAHVHPTARFLL